MSNIWILLKAQLINFFPINEIRDSRNKNKVQWLLRVLA